MTDTARPATPAEWNSRSQGRFPAFVGMEITAITSGRAEGRLPLRPHHFAPNGYLHAAAVITLADTICGYGCTESLPGGATGFTTVELKSNFFGTARDGVIVAVGRLIHGGRTTQVWDAEVLHEGTGRTLAVFRCTQMVLYPR